MVFVNSTKRWYIAATVALVVVAGVTVFAWPIVTGRSARFERKIDFAPAPLTAAQAIRADIAPDDLIDFVDVRRVDFALRRGSDLTGGVWNTFANNPHERSFGNVVVTKDSFRRTLAAYQARLVGKASALGLPSQTLKACLDSIAPRDSVPSRLPWKMSGALRT